MGEHQHMASSERGSANISNVACAWMAELRCHPVLDLRFQGAGESLGSVDREREIAPPRYAVGHR
jgi:hypothetical protein